MEIISHGPVDGSLKEDIEILISQLKSSGNWNKLFVLLINI